ncbi:MULTISPECIES: DUF1622 domain-containing protein [Streptomyces]|uniref:DUF1622 domain-containing protein n=1 Tax=Streptomyces changanensis TaxID=2964669 RepID=A0ABY5N6A5_9ACTN|nr:MULTISPECIES: DUF1622 domain-containing protein [Streptomyces]UUS32057.1 DUF1622 domain-containing protein [Streptomyces changanensis]
MTAVLLQASVLCAAMGLLACPFAYRATGRVPPTLAVLLDFLTAAGLLRLAAAPDWKGIATAAAVIALRKVVSGALGRAGPSAAGPSATGPSAAGPRHGGHPRG